MGLFVTLQVRANESDLARLQSRMTPELWQQPIADLMRDATSFAVREAQGGAQGLGAIASSITAELNPMGAKISATAPGAFEMEVGRRIGAKLPPPDALARYGTATFPIARAIGRRGIKGRFFMRKAKDALERSELPRLIARAKDQILARWSAE